MNPTAFTPNRRPDFFAPARNRSITAPCHTYTNRRDRVEIAAWDGNTFGPSRGFLLDTGSDFCTVDHAFAVAHNFQLDQHCQIAVGGPTGSGAAWLTKRYIRFQHLPTYRFSFHFLVPIPPSHPHHPQHDPNAPPVPTHPRLLGVADLLDAFELVVTGTGVGFYLRQGRGDRIGPDGRPVTR